MKTFQRILAVVLCLVMSLSVLGTVAFAAEGDPQTTAATIDTSKTGSITVHKYEQPESGSQTGTGEVQGTTGFTAMEGVEFTIYQVMNASQVLAYYDGTNAVTVTWQTFVSGSAGNYTVKKFVENDTTLTGELVEVTAKETKTTDADGEAKFEGLGVGMYIIIESKYPAEVTSPADPFLVSVPMTATNKTDWRYDINVYPKNDTSRGNVIIEKYSNDLSTPMKSSDVKFTLEKQNGNAWEYVNLTNNEYTFSSTTNAQEFTLTDGKLTFSNLPYGEYRLTETATADGYILDSRPVEFKIDDKGEITLTTTGVDTVSSVSGENGLTIKIINEKPDSKKEITKVNGTAVTGTDVKEASASVGDVITYKVTVNVPSNITLLKTFTVTDTPTNLKYNSISSITCEDAPVVAGAYTASAEGNGFKIVFTPSAMGDYAGKQIVIEYTATILASAADATAAPNTATLTYSNSILPEDSSDEPGNYEIKDGAVVYTYKLGVIKRKDSTTGDVMSGVEFKLYDSENSTTALKFTQNSGGSYVLDANGTETLTTGDDGKIVVKGLANGTYYLEETKTADDYNLLKGRVAVTVAIESTTKWKYTESYVNDVLTKQTYESATHTSDSEDIIALKNTTIVNKKGFDLPTTGGIGTLMFFIIGGVLIAGGICLITVPNKKRSV